MKDNILKDELKKEPAGAESWEIYVPGGGNRACVFEVSSNGIQKLP